MQGTPSDGLLAKHAKHAEWSEWPEPNKPSPNHALAYLRFLTEVFEQVKRTVDFMTVHYSDEDASERYEKYAADVQGVAIMEVHLFTLLIAVGKNYRNDDNDIAALRWTDSPPFPTRAHFAKSTLEHFVAECEKSKNWEEQAKGARDNLIAAGWSTRLPPPEKAAAFAVAATTHQRLTAPLKGRDVLYLSSHGWTRAHVLKDEPNTRLHVSYQVFRPVFSDEPDGPQTTRWEEKIIDRNETNV